MCPLVTFYLKSGFWRYAHLPLIVSSPRFACSNFFFLNPSLHSTSSLSPLAPLLLHALSLHHEFIPQWISHPLSAAFYSPHPVQTSFFMHPLPFFNCTHHLSSIFCRLSITSSFIHLLSAFNPTLLLSSIFSLPLLPLSLTLFSYNSTPPTTSSRELSFLYPSTYSLPFPQSAAPQRTALQSADVGLA